MPASTLQRHARVLMWLVTVPLALFVLLALLLVGNIVWQGGRYADGVAIYYLPMALYIWAIWMVRQALGAVAGGALFDAVLPVLLRRVGWALFAGASFTVVGVPVATALAFGHAWIPTFEPSPIALGVVGAALVLVARLLGHAATLRTELDGFV